MSAIAAGVLGFSVLIVMLVLRVPIALALLTVGGVGYAGLNGWLPLLNHLKTAPWFQFSTYSLSVIPLFLLMGQFALKAGMSSALFRAAYLWQGHRRGGVAMAAIGGCAGFGAICGSSLATAATMGQVALPELRRFRYSGSLATGALAAGGTLGILIPPSIILVIYALLTEQNIARMFAAAVVPALMAVVGYMLAIAVYVRIYPDAGPAGERASWRERFSVLAEVWPTVAIFALVVGGIYEGWFTPTEGAAIGAVGTGVLAVTRGGMRMSGFVECLTGTAAATAMIFLILLGAELFNAFLALTRLPMLAVDVISASTLSPIVILVGILAVYLLLGCVMDSLSMILLTIPVLFPVFMGLDFGLPPEHAAIWFGILVLIVVEVGLITPPVGMNVFIINAMARDVPMLETFRGVVPFLVADIVRIVLLIAFPVLALWLVDFG